MNQDRDNNLPSAESDPLVSAEYRASATERTPPALDAVVLEKARAAPKNARLRGFYALWFRPLAFVTTLVLSLALLLELTNTPQLQPILDAETEIGRRQPQASETAPTDAADGVISEFRHGVDSPAWIERRDAKNESTSGKPQSPEPSASAENLNLSDDVGDRERFELTPVPMNDVKTTQAPGSANAPVSDERASAGFAEMIEAGSKRMQEKDSVMETAIQGLHQTRAAEEPQIEEVAAGSAFAVVPDRAARSCLEEQMSDPLKWWQCITDLKAAGRDDDAKAELDLFNATYPDFEPPDAP